MTKHTRIRMGVIVGLLAAAAAVVWWSLAGREGSEVGRLQEEERRNQETIRQQYPDAVDPPRPDVTREHRPS